MLGLGGELALDGTVSAQPSHSCGRGDRRRPLRVSNRTIQVLEQTLLANVSFFGGYVVSLPHPPRFQCHVLAHSSCHASV